MSKDPLLVNKIFGAVLVAAWVIVIAAFAGALLYRPEETVEEFAYPIAVEEAAPVEEAVPAEEAAPAAPAEEAAAVEEAPAEAPAAGIAALLTGADADAGAKVARKCSACHTFDSGGAHRVGPNLWNVVNRPVGRAEGYKYSSALADKGGEWSYEALSTFLTAPKEYVPGTKMSFAGIKEDQDRADLIAYLRSLSDSPAPLP